MNAASFRPAICLLILAGLATPVARAAAPALTIYNQNFAVVRETVALDLKPGVHRVQFSGATAFLEPSSVVLRDPSTQHPFQILEQNFRGDPVSEEMLMLLNEGNTIEFEPASDPTPKKKPLIQGKIIRAGHNPHSRDGGGFTINGDPIYEMQPIIEVGGKLQFSLPGKPIFPSLSDNTVLKPTLHWLIDSADAQKFNAELSYITGEMSWEADYNLVLPEKGSTLDVAGWVTIDNQSGNSFANARIELMAGDVHKIQGAGVRRENGGGGGGGGGGQAPPVTEKTFDEYHLYTLERPTTLLDQQKKQVEFVRAAEVNSTVIYVYDGWEPSAGNSWPIEHANTDPEYGVQSNKKIWVFREFVNSATNHLGLPLPRGRVRVYRRNAAQMEFVGENLIDHTPRDEVVRLSTGNAFDVVGERKQTNVKMNLSGGMELDATGLPIAAVVDSSAWIDESFEIKLRNHKTEAVNVRVVEHLYRWSNWRIKEKSDDFRKTDSQTIEFAIPLKPDEERTVTYTVRYSWN